MSSSIEDFAALVASFKAGEPKTHPTHPTTLVASIKCLAASFDAVVVDFGIEHTPRFVAQVVKRDNTGSKVIWDSTCRSQNQAKSEAENACRSFAANEAYTS